jgi:hypothetical protein
MVEATSEDGSISTRSLRITIENLPFWGTLQYAYVKGSISIMQRVPGWKVFILPVMLN